MSRPFYSEKVPRSLPTKILLPLFNLGANVCRNSVSSDDTNCGLILGMPYIWGKHLLDWQARYYIALHADSPFYPWAKFDWSWQKDLTVISAKGCSTE